MEALQIGGISSALGGSTGSFILGIILLAVGLVLAFFGEDMWSAALAVIGGLIGGLIGFAIGYMLFGDWLLPLIIGLICAIIGSILFAWMVKAALAMLIAVIAAGIVFLILPEEYVIAIVAFVIVFILAYFFMEKIVEFLTSFVGGVIAGVGAYVLISQAGWASAALWIAIGIGALVFILGAIYQLVIEED